MKKIFIFSFFVFSIILVSCSGKKQNDSQPSAHETFVSELTNQDTAAVRQLCENFLLAMVNNDKDQAFSLLSSFEDGKIAPVSSEQMAKLSHQFTIFPVLKYQLKDFMIGDATDNICSYSIVFNIDEQGNESTINFGFCPVKVNNKWYITVRNASAKLPQ